MVVPKEFNDLKIEKLVAGYPASMAKVKTHFKLLNFQGDNWGWLSTYFPNRTENWGYQKYLHDEKFRVRMMAFLNDPRLEFIVTQQHFNLTHPKLISKPLGILPGERQRVAGCHRNGAIRE